MNQTEKIVVVLPAYNAEKTLKETIQSIPSSLSASLLLVDDGSTDQTVDLAKELGIPVFTHSENKGYGANQKTCYTQALKMGATIVVMVHPDHQYDERMIPALIAPIQLGVCDVMFGNRIRQRQNALQGGMPLYKYVLNRISTLLENFILGQNLGEVHSGMRAYRREVLEKIPWQSNSNGFLFDQQFLIQCVWFHFRMGDVPVPVRYFKEASTIGLLQSLWYGLGGFWTLILYLLAITRLLRSRIFQ